MNCTNCGMYHTGSCPYPPPTWRVPSTWPYYSPPRKEAQVCPLCHGDGVKHGFACRACAGKGIVWPP